jgi:putative ABC transport system permease protein
VTALSAVVGLFLARLLLPAFNALSSRDLQMTLDAESMLIPLLLFLLVGLAAGAYPALVLSGFNPNDASLLHGWA